jgi:hypothetical protein
MPLTAQASTHVMQDSETGHERKSEAVSEDDVPHLKTDPAKQIQQFSHSMDKFAIAAYVDECFDLRENCERELFLSQRL